MSRNRKRAIVALALTALLLLGLLGSAALAQGRRGAAPGGCPLANNSAQLAELGITSEQAAQLEQIRREMRLKAAPLRSQIEVAQIELEQLMDSDSPDLKAVESKLRQIGELRLQMQMLRIKADIDSQKIVGRDAMQRLRALGPGPRGGRGEHGPQCPGFGPPDEPPDGRPN